jgi:hypothetical protein
MLLGVGVGHDGLYVLGIGFGEAIGACSDERKGRDIVSERVK